ncbi:MAG: bifunctional folylpolyglutamate synthase/dihydrofolate synthase [Gammaproteobacteria bacterium]|nr:bifunctional folylpolyglutamate synthase/dihydrofolate synthase [Gammaproteobacteria bacterium]
MKDTTLADWLEHIQKQHWRSIDMRLDRAAEVWEKLGVASDLHSHSLTITIVGTNGKGSCVAMLEAVLREAGLRVGSYTSPHLVRYNERVRVNGREAGDEELCRAFSAVESARGSVPLTYFEFGTLCALWLFARARAQVLLLEAGMGGRLDAVNIVKNDLALITSIGMDHARWLGDDREKIAAEKAGVLKTGALAVCADPHPPECIARIAAERDCMLLQSGRDYKIAPHKSESENEHKNAGDFFDWQSAHAAVPESWRCMDGLRAPLPGARQRDNLGGVITTLALLRGKTKLGRTTMRAGLAKTALRARCQVIAGAPEIILDVAHNRDSAKTLAEFLARRAPAKRAYGVAGILADKPLAEIFAEICGAVDCWHFATLGGERGQPASALRDALAQIAPEAASAAKLHDTPLAAFLAAVGAAAAEKGGSARVIVFGSFQTVGAILGHLETAHPPVTSPASPSYPA